MIWAMLETSPVGTGVLAVFGLINLSTLVAIGTLIFRVGREVEKLEALTQTVESMKLVYDQTVRHEQRLQYLEAQWARLEGQNLGNMLARISAQVDSLDKRYEAVHSGMHALRNTVMEQLGKAYLERRRPEG